MDSSPCRSQMDLTPEGDDKYSLLSEFIAGSNLTVSSEIPNGKRGHRVLCGLINPVFRFRVYVGWPSIKASVPPSATALIPVKVSREYPISCAALEVLPIQPQD